MNWGKSIVCLLVLFVAACGGGSGGSGGGGNAHDGVDTSHETGREQNIRFVDRADIELDAGESYNNPVIKCCGGYNGTPVTLDSSDPAVATVDQAGRVSALRPGTAKISARKQGGGGYRDAHVSYRVTVPDYVSVNVLLGANNSSIFMADDAGPFELYRSRYGLCDFENYMGCHYGLMNVWNGSPIFDIAARVGQAAVLGLQQAGIDYGRQWINPGRMPGRSSFSLVHFQGQLWAIGGYGGWFERKNDIWSSHDGAHWVQRNAAPAFTPRVGHQVVAFNDHLLLIGGRDADGFQNDIWISADGIDWAPLAGRAPFAARAFHQVVVHDGRIWLSGGEDVELKNDVWSSNDGQHWRLETPNAAFAARHNHQMVSFQNQLWVFGGEGASYNEFNDIWSSEDGVQWVQRGKWPMGGTIANDYLRGRAGHQIVSFKDKLWLVAGDSGSYQQDVWSSVDGIEWKMERKNAGFPRRSHHQVVVFNDQLVLAGGYFGYTDSPYFGHKSDVWASSNGVNWRLLNERMELQPFGNKNVVQWNNRLRVYSGSGMLDNDQPSGNVGVFESHNGWDWVSAGERVNCAGKTSLGSTILAFRSRLWWIGDQCKLIGAELWSNLLSSSDGLNWTTHTPAGFGNIVGHEAVVFNDQLWVIGGSRSPQSFIADFTNDVWSSVDGVNWELRNAEPGFPNLEGAQVAEFNGKLWLSGGYEVRTTVYESSNGTSYHNTFYYHRLLWSSENGVDWTSHNASADFGYRTGHQMVAFRERLWLIGGRNRTTSFADIWVSDDGVTWNREAANLAVGPVSGHRVLVEGDKLLLIRINGEIWESSDAINWSKRLVKRFRAPSPPDPNDLIDIGLTE